MIQIDIDMPTDCASCWIRQNMGCKIANESGWLNNRRDDKCPLKEQKAVTIKKTKEHGFGVYGGICPKCRNWIQSSHSFCGFCGQEVKWNG